jgi:hypothetical protein
VFERHDHNEYKGRPIVPPRLGFILQFHTFTSHKSYTFSPSSTHSRSLHIINSFSNIIIIIMKYSFVAAAIIGSVAAQSAADLPSCAVSIPAEHNIHGDSSQLQQNVLH